jgi:hypothetical protein
MFFIFHTLAGFLAYLLYMKKQVSKTEISVHTNELILCLLAGWFGLGYVFGKYYR